MSASRQAEGQGVSAPTPRAIAAEAALVKAEERERALHEQNEQLRAQLQATSSSDGWRCPGCGRCWGPQVAQCRSCAERVRSDDSLARRIHAGQVRG
jgi:hypothetical protein